MKVSKLCIVLVVCLLSRQSHQEPAAEDDQVPSEEPIPEVEIVPAFDDSFRAGEYNHQVTISYGCPVNPSRPCVSKCCDLNKTHANLKFNQSATRCVDKYVDFWLEYADRPDYGRNDSLAVQDRYEYFIGDPCKTGKYILEPELYDTDQYSLYSNGSMLISGKFYPMSDYCMDEVDGVIRAFICFETITAESLEFYHILYPVGQLLSIPFLLATAAIYMCVEEYRDLQGKTLVCHVCCLAVAFFFLALVQLSGPTLNQAFCTAAAFIIQFSFVACFFWLNVLCYDSFTNFRNVEKRPHINERRRFIMYSLYAWNGPMILFIVSLVIDMVPGLPDHFLRPQFGSESCWFSSETAALPYFFGPVGLLLGINAVLFIWTAYTKCQHIKLEFKEENRRTGNKKKKYQLYLKNVKQSFKLFLTMGVCWLAEVISWAIGGSRYIWITTDVINTLQGLLIFYFYVWEPTRVREKLKDFLARCGTRMCPCLPKPQPVAETEQLTSQTSTV